ncbi:hypothetical protein O6H91_02G147700 [Diphasiastrum complanatum]|uniref:Uncharacterized protein n=1 Tax=Diphasiastrum complanatum TaxID=34168 RepID=A0ACC2ELU6_DIPCM|nr:hypothetical protein O6H91_02G147700 [Diphasiastrum complanatum]
MSAASALALLLISVWVITETRPALSAVFYDHVSKGFQASSINWVDANGFFLHSINSSFALGFCNPGSVQAYFLCVVHVSTQQIMWTANRNSPISISDQMIFQDNGDISLYNSTGSVVWSSGTAMTGAELLQLQESGNLAVLDSTNQSLWQSFDHPTDTLLLGQKLKSGVKLINSISATNLSEGRYSLQLEAGSLLLSAEFSSPQAYWSMNTDVRTISMGSDYPSYASLAAGVFGLYGNSSFLVSEIVLASAASNTLRRAVLKPNGNLVTSFYAGTIWNEDFNALQDVCSLPGACGQYGVCSNAGQCSCPQSLSPLNSSNVAQGCGPPAQLPCTNSSTDISFRDMGSGLDYFFNRFSAPLNASSLKACQNLCLQNCSCSALFYHQDSNDCYLSGELGSLEYKGTATSFTFLKVLTSTETPSSAPLVTANSGGASYIVYIIVGCSVAFILVVVSIFACWFYRRKKASSSAAFTEDDGFLESLPGLPTRFSYKQLQTATNNFSTKLGTGGFGSVYEGILADKSRVAVKKLESVAQGKKEFRAEVATIGSIHHVHLVQLKGFCAEGIHRLLVYEFMARSSLDRSLFTETADCPPLLDWSTRINIALGTARGLAYLHEDCRERIIHCDIKPENILLDDNFLAKVSDFGLAKLMNREQSNVFTTLRGTRGYLAPEWLMNYPISEKSDVYSFGMVLLELISGRKNFDPTEVSEKWYFPAYALQQAEEGKCEMLIDPKLKNVTDEEVTKVVQIALLCIQEEVHLRPSMGKVVQMLEGIIEVPYPPLSSQFAVGLHARMLDAISQREQSIASTDYNSQDLLSASQLSGPR